MRGARTPLGCGGWGRFAVGIAVLAAIACGIGHSGLDPDRSWDDLSEDEIRRFCEWAVDAQGGENVVTPCEDLVNVDSGTVEGCVEGAPLYEGCGLTVGDMEACIRERARDPCEGNASEACRIFAECVFR